MSLDWIKNEFYRINTLIRNEATLSNLIERCKQKKGIERFRNIHLGKRCFVIGNGPSLLPEDLDLLKNEICFAANRIFYIYDKTDWRPTYYCAQDKDVFEDIVAHIGDVSNASNACFFSSYCKKILDKSSTFPKNVHYYYAHLMAAHKKRKFSDSAERYVDGGGTITYAAIQLAVYMGIKEIYLLGVDHNYASSSFANGKIDSEDVKRSYFAGMPSDIVLTKPNTDNSTISFLEAKRYAQTNGIKIYNATRGGKLEIFERVSLESVMNNED